ncbi:MAG: spore germination protein [Firmicutes bacterium]|nr:spore germination protein [Bacillota bacterium]
MPIGAQILKFLQFKEPMAEPEFVLAWDEPEETGEGRKREPDQILNRPIALDERPDWELTGDPHRDAANFIRFFGGPDNQILGQRRFTTGKSTIVILFCQYLIDPGQHSALILEPLSKISKYDLENVLTALSSNRTQVSDDIRYGLNQLGQGRSLILIPGAKKFIMAGTGQAPHRPVAEAINERVVFGPQEGFSEDLATNIALVQKRFRSNLLTVETVEVGSMSRTRCAILSVNGITNPRLTAEVKRRINGINLSHLTDSGMLEQLIEDNSRHLYPQILSTERPDRIAAALDEGKVAVLVDGSQMALAMPITVIGQLHSMEDYSVRWPYAVYLRLIRILGAFLILFLPAFYLAANLYQPELLPTDVLIALVTIKQQAPLPTIIEVLLLEFIFDVLREAGFRGPRNMAAPLTIVVGTVLGLTAAFTGIVNPVLMLVIAVSGIAGFLIPEFSTSLSFRLTRYFYTLIAFLFGFIGIAFGAFIHLHLLAKQKSFGVPMLAPIGPFTRRSGDIILIKPLASRDKRPDFLDALRSRKKPEKPQTWKTDQSQPEKTLGDLEGSAPKND